MAVEIRDAGSLEKIKSLAGIEGRSTLVFMDNIPVGASGLEAVLPSRPERRWAIIQNNPEGGSIARFRVVFEGQVVDGYLILDPGDSFQIDDNIPWTGAVWIGEASGNAGTVSVVECRVLK